MHFLSIQFNIELSWTLWRGISQIINCIINDTETHKKQKKKLLNPRLNEKLRITMALD